MTYDNPWTFNGKVFDSEDIQNYFGFCYLITNTVTGKKYIGRKYFISNRKDPKKKRKRIIKESDWKTYWGSCKPLLADIEKAQSTQDFKREILSLHKTKGLTNYNETRWQFILDVLVTKNDSGERLFYNDHILSRYYAKNILDKE